MQKSAKPELNCADAKDIVIQPGAKASIAYDNWNNALFSDMGKYKIEFKSYTNQKGISIPTVIVNGDEYTGFWNDEFDGIHFNPITMETKINNNEDFIKESIKYKGLKNMMSNKDYENYLKMNDSEKLNFLEILFNTQLNEQDVKNNNDHIIKHVLIEEENNITNLPTCI